MPIHMLSHSPPQPPQPWEIRGWRYRGVMVWIFHCRKKSSWRIGTRGSKVLVENFGGALSAGDPTMRQNSRLMAPKITLR